MVTASHNPPEYNGYKVYWSNGAQIIPPHDLGIAQEIDRAPPAKEIALLTREEASRRGLWKDVPESVGRAYLEAILALRLHPGAPKDFPIVYTALHGVGGPWIVRAFAAAGFKRLHPVAAQQAPDGAFPTVRFPNPEEKGAMDLALALAEEKEADLVLANDPDADRLAVAVRQASGRLRLLTGNEVGVLLGHYLLTQKRPKPKKPWVITTIVSSAQLQEIARASGAGYDEVLTGFKWVANRAMEREAQEGAEFLMGYEEALGYTVGTVARDKDGIGTALVFADLVAHTLARGQTVLGYLEEIQRQFGLFVADQKSFTFPGASGAKTIQGIMEAFRARPPARIGAHAVTARRDYLEKGLSPVPSNVLAYDLDGGSRVTLRPSGTEPKVKYYFELREPLTASEPLETARSRALEKLNRLSEAFVALAQERGQP
jgi:phosphomannomutase